MNICIPVTADLGLESPVSGHFGSAPIYILVDSGTGLVKALTNPRVAHEHGACSPLDAFAGHEVDVVLVGGIGPGALAKLRAAGARVYRATAPTVAGCLDAFERHEAEEIAPGGACGGHGHGHDDGPPALPTRT